MSCRARDGGEVYAARITGRLRERADFVSFVARGDSGQFIKARPRAVRAARAPMPRARARAGTGRPRALRARRRCAGVHGRVAQSYGEVARPARVADATDRAAGSRAWNSSSSTRTVDEVTLSSPLRTAKSASRSSCANRFHGQRAGSRRSRRRDCRSAAAAPRGCCSDALSLGMRCSGARRAGMARRSRGSGRRRCTRRSAAMLRFAARSTGSGRSV